jgi:hypothetical protein
MTRALRWHAELRRRWAERSAAPPPEWLEPLPPWVDKAPQLARICAGAAQVWKEGEPALALLLMANSVLFEPTGPDAPGEVLWSEDPAVLRYPERLERASAAFWELRRNGSEAPGLRSLVAFAKDDHRGTSRVLFPSLLSDGYSIHHQVVLFRRSQLPGGKMGGSLVPIVWVRSGRPDTAMALPQALWPEELVALWLSDRG